MKQFFISALIISTLSISCKKDDSSSNGGSGDYMTFAADRQWTYERSEGGSVSNYTLLSTGNDTSISVGGQIRTYKVFTKSGDETGNEYFLTQGSDYFRIESLLTANLFENKYLIDNQPEGYSWDGGILPFTLPINDSINIPDTISFNGLSVPPGMWKFSGTLNASISLINSIERKDTSMNVSGMDFANVIKVRTKPTVTNSSISNFVVKPPSIPFGIPLSPTVNISLPSDISGYYAKGFGMILEKNKLDFSATASLLGQTFPVPAFNLSNYSIKLKSKNF